MANPTTNYGFVLPTSTDLVTDLPADFDVALQGVDTRLKALQPGTTSGDLAYSSATANTNVRLGIGTNGQVLAVSSGVPAWTTTSDVTPLTTKGDLFTFSTVDARLAVGTNGQVLTADSSEATGLKYATPAGGGVIHLKTASFSNVASTTTTFDALFTSAYNAYTIVFNSITAGTGNDDLHLQLRYAGPTTQTADYRYKFGQLDDIAPIIQTFTGSISDSQYVLSTSIGASAGYGLSGTVQLNNTLVAGSRPVITFMNNGENMLPTWGCGLQTTSRIYTGFLFKSSSSNITGSVSVYGLVNA